MKRILLLDDETAIVDQIARALKKGYLTVKTNSAFEALSFLDSGRGAIDLVICDYNMPGMNGAEFVDQMRKLRIKTPVLLCTGAIVRDDGNEQKRFVKILQKPFDTQQLLEAVDGALQFNERPPEAIEALARMGEQLRTTVLELQNYLLTKSSVDPGSLDAESAKKIYLEEDYDGYLAWRHLRLFCCLE